MSKNERAAYSSWIAQRSRCNNPKDARYPYYGAKGIKVFYSSREFISWWLEGLKKNNLNGTVVCGRIDHSKGYSFDNIRLETQRSNVLECASRGVCNVKVNLVSETGIVLKKFSSVKEAAAYAKVGSNSIVQVCKGRTKRTKGLIFRYEA